MRRAAPGGGRGSPGARRRATPLQPSRRPSISISSRHSRLERPLPFGRHRLAGHHPPHDAEHLGGERHRAHPVVAERLEGHRHPGGDGAEHRLGIGADLVLGVAVGAQRQEVQEVLEVRLPVPLGVGVEREVHARQLPRQALAGRVERRALGVLVQHLGVVVVGLRGVAPQQVEHPRRLRAVQHLAPALAVAARLRRQVLRAGDVELPVEDGVAGAVLVHVRRAVPDPLPRHEDRQLHMVLDLAHLEGRRVPVPHEVADQAAILVRRPGAAAVGDARGLHDGGVVAHVVDHPDEAVVEHRDRLEEHGFQRRHDRAAGAALGGAGGLDLPLLLGRQRHAASPSIRAVRNAYISVAASAAMAINTARNKRCGPGGSARRLHHFPPQCRGRAQGWTGGRNRLDARGKGAAFARHGSAVIGPSISANDNSREAVALAA